jgi:hypothetical protein
MSIVTQSLFLLSDYELNTLADSIIENCNDIREVREKLSDFTSYIEREVIYSPSTTYDVSNIQLLNITKILVRIKDSISKES